MAPPTSGLSRTLQTLTITKIREINKQRKKYEDRKLEILTKAEELAGDEHALVAHLLKGVKAAVPNAADDESLASIRRWLDQSRYDASIPLEKLKSFEKQLRSKLDIESRKLNLANLYSQLMTEWMNPPVSAQVTVIPEDTEESFEVLERQKERLQELCDKFESVVFEPLETEESKIHQYMQSLFEDDKEIKALEHLRSHMEEASQSLLRDKAPFNKDTLIWCIKGLLAEDLLSEEKQNALSEFLENDLLLGEIADVLNMRFADLESWTWEADEGIPVMPRQQLNGKYRIWMDEDVLQAIFVHFIGIEWCVRLKGALTTFIPSFFRWNQGTAIPQEALDRRSFYLLDSYGGNYSSYRAQGSARIDVHLSRRNEYCNTFFLSSLPSTRQSIYDGGLYDNDNCDDEHGNPVKNSSTKQKLLRKLATEVSLHQSLNGEVAIIQSDLQWYATGLSHSTIFAIMKFVGFSEEWTSFFKKFLEAPLNMAPASGDSGGARIRKRGVPMAHAPEKLLGELVLFIMDLAVNQKSGMLLYRLHDDLWLVGEPAQCAQAWKTMEEFTSICGLEFNYNKTGSVYITENDKKKDASIIATLPPGPVTVGFLALDPITSTWTIDQTQVDAHIKQLQKQLAACDSVLSWIQTWNSCIGRFFSHTFGEPAYCFGRQHVDSIIETHERMQNILFDGKNGNGTNVTNHLKNMIKSRFGVTDIPDAFLYLPEQLGGLGLRNPFIPFFLVREQLTEDPKDKMAKFLGEERKEYETLKKAFDELGQDGRRKRFRNIYPHGVSSKTPQQHELDTFMSYQEYIQWREFTSSKLLVTYESLLCTPEAQSLYSPPLVTWGLEDLANELPQLRRMTEEVKWIVELHAEEVLEKFGGMSMVEKGFLPLGVLTMMRQKKVTWQMVL